MGRMGGGRDKRKDGREGRKEGRMGGRKGGRVDGRKEERKKGREEGRILARHPSRFSPHSSAHSLSVTKLHSSYLPTSLLDGRFPRREGCARMQQLRLGMCCLWIGWIGLDWMDWIGWIGLDWIVLDGGLWELRDGRLGFR